MQHKHLTVQTDKKKKLTVITRQKSDHEIEMEKLAEIEATLKKNNIQ